MMATLFRRSTTPLQASYTHKHKDPASGTINLTKTGKPFTATHRFGCLNLARPRPVLRHRQRAEARRKTRSPPSRSALIARNYPNDTSIYRTPTSASWLLHPVPTPHPLRRLRALRVLRGRQGRAPLTPAASAPRSSANTAPAHLRGQRNVRAPRAWQLRHASAAGQAQPRI